MRDAVRGPGGDSRNWKQGLTPKQPPKGITRGGKGVSQTPGESPQAKIKEQASETGKDVTKHIGTPGKKKTERSVEAKTGKVPPLKRQSAEKDLKTKAQFAAAEEELSNLSLEDQAGDEAVSKGLENLSQLVENEQESSASSGFKQSLHDDIGKQLDELEAQVKEQGEQVNKLVSELEGATTEGSAKDVENLFEKNTKPEHKQVQDNATRRESASKPAENEGPKQDDSEWTRGEAHALTEKEKHQWAGLKGAVTKMKNAFKASHRIKDFDKVFGSAAYGEDGKIIKDAGKRVKDEATGEMKTLKFTAHERGLGFILEKAPFQSPTKTKAHLKQWMRFAESRMGKYTEWKPLTKTLHKILEFWDKKDAAKEAGKTKTPAAELEREISDTKGEGMGIGAGAGLKPSKSVDAERSEEVSKAYKRERGTIESPKAESSTERKELREIDEEAGAIKKDMEEIPTVPGKLKLGLDAAKDAIKKDKVSEEDTATKRPRYVAR